MLSDREKICTIVAVIKSNFECMKVYNKDMSSSSNMDIIAIQNIIIEFGLLKSVDSKIMRNIMDFNDEINEICQVLFRDVKNTER